MKRRPLQNILLFVVETALLSLLVLSCGGGSDDDERAQDPPVFPPAVFVADKDTNGIDELYAAFDDGTDIVKLSTTSWLPEVMWLLFWYRPMVFS